METASWFNLPVSGGGTLTFGNQQIPGNLWLWVGAILLVVVILVRK